MSNSRKLKPTLGLKEKKDKRLLNPSESFSCRRWHHGRTVAFGIKRVVLPKSKES